MRGETVARIEPLRKSGEALASPRTKGSSRISQGLNAGYESASWGGRSMRIVMTSAFALLCWLTAPATAQDYPTRAVTIICAYPPGGSVDLTARALAPALERIFKQPVVIQNRG